MAANFSDYTSANAGTGAPSAPDEEETKDYKSLHDLKREYLNYLGQKREEIDEQQESRRYRHGSHWTSEQLEQLKRRRQPATYENIVGRKIHGVVGTLERLRQDPKAFARTPQHEEGAELATGALRYALESQEWSAKDPICSEGAAVDGFGGLELSLTEGDHGDKEIELLIVDNDTFFYDPVSYRHDFSDARYMGISKWFDIDTAVNLFPDKKAELEALGDTGSELSTDSDRENRWYNSEDDIERVRIVEHWYKHKGDQWCWCTYTGSFKLAEGKSFLKDEKGKDACKFIMFSAYIDQDGDRYGLVRDLKPLNQEIDMRKSKALYTMLSRRIIAERGAFDDIEVARREAARSDGVVIRNKGFEAEFDDTGRTAETEAQFKFYELNRTAIESFGPNIAVTGQGLETSSGRAIQLLQQAGLSDLGPFLQSYRGWKIRLYRAVWNAIQQHWTGERWIRVTDSDDIAQFIKVNGVQTDPMTGKPQMVNALGSLDVDIILDEGPDAVNQMADSYDTLTAMAQKGAEIPPAILIELSPLQSSVKKKLMEILNPTQPDPKQQMKEQLEFKAAAAEIMEKEAAAMLKKAQAQKALREAEVVQPEQPEQGDAGDHPMKIQSEAMEKAAAAKQKEADAIKKHAETQKILQDIQLEPQRMAMEHEQAQQKMQFDAQKAQMDMRTKQQDQQLKARQAETSAKQSATDSKRNYEVNKMKAKQKPSPKAK